MIDNPENMAALEHDLERSLLRDSFADYCAWAWPLITGKPLVWNEMLRDLVAALQRVADGQCTRQLVAMPPGVGKSTALACYASWRLARNPAHASINMSHAASLADTSSLRVRRLVEGDAYRAMWPAVRLRSDEGTVAAWATTAGGRYYAVGRDTALTGRRAMEAVLDDPLDAVDRYSKAARESLWAYFAESLSTRLDGDGAPVIVCHQRLDRDDLIGRLIAAGGWTLLELPAEREDGTLLAPNVLSREKLDALKVQIGSVAYSVQYLQRAISDDAAFPAKRSWWRFHRALNVPANSPRPAGCDTDTPAVLTPERFERIVIACDLTFGSATGDYAAVAAWGSYKGGRYLIDLWRKRAGFEEQLAAIEAMRRRHPGAKVLVEKAANGAAVIETLRKKIPGIVALKPRGAKAARLSIISPQAESGALYLPLGAPWLVDFVEELAGATKHDDMADATAYAVSDLEQLRGGSMPICGGIVGDSGGPCVKLTEYDLDDDDGPIDPRQDGGYDVGPVTVGGPVESDWWPSYRRSGSW